MSYFVGHILIVWAIRHGLLRLLKYETTVSQISAPKLLPIITDLSQSAKHLSVVSGGSETADFRVVQQKAS